MPQRRVFISHSANRDVASQPVLNDLEARLNALGDVEVLLDHSSLTAGEDWRSSINVWCGLCDAAILLVTRHSLTADFCIYEWSILGYRRAMTNHFSLLVLYVGTSPDDLRNKPQNLAEIQGVDTTSVAAAWPRIQEWLNTVAPVEGPTQHQARLIASLLSERLKVDGPQMHQARELGKLPLGAWRPLQDPWEQFALQLIGLGLQKAMPALLELQGEFKKYPQEWNEIIDLVCSSWVDDRASSRLAQLSREGSTDKSVALNASNGSTGRLYIIKASGRRPSASWCMGTVIDSVGTFDGLKKNVSKSLRQVLNVGPDADLNRRLQVKRNNQQPVVLYLNGSGLDASWLARLRNDFDYVTFFVLAGSETVDMDGVEWLRPEVLPEFEQAFWSYYDDNQVEFILPCS